MTQPSELALYARVFDHYAGVAVYGEQARELIEAALSELEQSQAAS